jgi:CspA family cold shock protein
VRSAKKYQPLHVEPFGRTAYNTQVRSGIACCAPATRAFLKTALNRINDREGPSARDQVFCIQEGIMPTGTVKWFNPTKGYGFIQPQGGGRDVFVHISAVERAGLSSLNEGQTVEYEIVSNRGKESADNLKVR